ncbi:prolyl 3-hydroxylase 1-like [Petromyzon marinus]|uniref:prolyl 3-hydroxylase 1-like n=1 Tax=Petromyzon marinus TaxID=7757 RepID=UPI003F6FF3FF
MSPLLLLLPPLLLLLLCSSVASLLASPGQEPWGSPGSLGAESLQPVDVLYASGVDAYGRDDWPGVIRYMNLALRSARAVRAARLHCRRSCDGTNGTRVHLGGEPGRHRVGEQLVEEFRRRAPYHYLQMAYFQVSPTVPADGLLPGESYHYLQMAYFQMAYFQVSPTVPADGLLPGESYHYLQMAYFQTKALGRAAACAHTFHVANPGHVEMKKNLDFYRGTGAVPDHGVRRLGGTASPVARPHLESLLKGARHYREERYEYAVEHVETALEELGVALAECRALCDAAPMAHEGYAYLDYSADLMQSLTDHYVQVLGCRQECGRELATRPGRQDPIDDFVPAHYNFLQYSYYKNGDYERAIASAASFLLFHPDDRTMQHNVDFYRSLHTSAAADIPPRQEALAFVRRSLMEKKMLYFASEVFGVPFVDPDGWTPAHIIPASLRAPQPASGSVRPLPWSP